MARKISESEMQRRALRQAIDQAHRSVQRISGELQKLELRLSEAEDAAHLLEDSGVRSVAQRIASGGASRLSAAGREAIAAAARKRWAQYRRAKGTTKRAKR